MFNQEDVFQKQDEYQNKHSKPNKNFIKQNPTQQQSPLKGRNQVFHKSANPHKVTTLEGPCQKHFKYDLDFNIARNIGNIAKGTHRLLKLFV